MEIVLVIAALISFLFAFIAFLSIGSDIQIIIVAVCVIGGIMMLGLAAILARLNQVKRDG